MICEAAESRTLHFAIIMLSMTGANPLHSRLLVTFLPSARWWVSKWRVQAVEMPVSETIWLVTLNDWAPRIFETDALQTLTTQNWLLFLINKAIIVCVFFNTVFGMSVPSQYEKNTRLLS